MCKIEINKVAGYSVSGNQPRFVVVFGTATDCALIRVICQGAAGYQVSAVQNGSWAAVFENPDGCTCDGNVKITAQCIFDDNCYDKKELPIECQYE